MVSNDFLVEESVKNYKKIKKKRKYGSRLVAAGTFIGCITLGAVMPLALAAIGGVLATSGVAMIASIGAMFMEIIPTLGGVISSCLVGGCAGVIAGGVASLVNKQSFSYLVKKQENNALRGIAEARQAKYLEQIANKNQISVCSPQELDGRSSERERLLK